MVRGSLDRLHFTVILVAKSPEFIILILHRMAMAEGLVHGGGKSPQGDLVVL